MIQGSGALPSACRRSEVYLQRITSQDRLILSEPYLHTRTGAVETAIHTQHDLTSEGRRAVGEEEVKAIGRARLPDPTWGLLESIIVALPARLLLTPHEGKKETKDEECTSQWTPYI